MLRKSHRRISRAGGDYQPQLLGEDEAAREIAARALGIFQGHVGEPRRSLAAALDELEQSVGDADGVAGGPDAYKLVRGLSHLLERAATFETDAPIPPARARRVAFESAELVGVTDEASRREALAAASDRLGVEPTALERSLYADREIEQTMTAFDADWQPGELCRRYDFALAASALLDATAVRVRSSDPKRVVSAASRLGLLYDIRRPEATAAVESIHPPGSNDTRPSGEGVEPVESATLSDRVVVVTGPDAIFRRTRRYGTAFASLLRTLVRHVSRWELTARIDDRGTTRELRLTDGDVPVPGEEPTGEPAFDSGVERDFARRFRALDLDWTLRREPEPLRVVGDDEHRVMIPDFAFEYDHAPFRLFFEVMGFWTPAYVESKLRQLAGVEGVELLVAVDESLGVGEAVETRDHRVIEYDGQVRVKDVVDALGGYEDRLRETATAGLPTELRPAADVVAADELADRHGVPTEALDEVRFPDHERVGGQLLRPATLNELQSALSPGMDYEAAKTLLHERGVTEASAVLGELGYRVDWQGLSGGSLRRL